MRKIHLAFALALTACSSPRATEAVNTTSTRLIGGVADVGDPAVVVFDVTGANGGDCTAEFISTTVLLSAAHCVFDDNGHPLTGAQYRIYMGSDFSQATDADWIYIDPKDVHPHPAYNGNDNDISVLVLTKPVAVTPLPFNTKALTQADVGQSVRLIGYGATVTGSSSGNDGFGLKRQLTTTVDDIATTGVVHVGKTGHTACSGDSGGPALLVIDGVETIIGVDSYSNAKVDCTEGEYYQRVDTQAAFIAKYLTIAAPDAGSDEAGGGSSSGGSSSGEGASSSSGGGSSGSAGGDQAQPGNAGDATHHSNTSASAGCAAAPSAPDASWALALAIAVVARRRRGRVPER
jgi:secreted trypsin-like serine protease